MDTPTELGRLVSALSNQAGVKQVCLEPISFQGKQLVDIKLVMDTAVLPQDAYLQRAWQFTEQFFPAFPDVFTTQVNRIRITADKQD